MRRTLLIFALILFSASFGQSVQQINKNLNIPNTLQSTEIRIYKWYSTTNGSDVFRMFMDEKKVWHIFLYEHFNGKTEFNVTNLTSTTDSELIFREFILTNIEYVPSIEEIEYKLNDLKIAIEDGKYCFQTTTIRVSDGRAYHAFFKNGSKQNDFEFNNFEAYFREFPEVDELNSYAKIIAVITNSFGIWK